MQVNNNNNISFGTNIKFVSPGCFRRVAKKMEKTRDFECITDWNIVGEGIGFRENVNRGITGGIRSCTAGVVAKKGSNAPIFWHICDNEENIKYMPILEEKMQGDNAVIVGSKSAFYYSKKLCNKFQSAMRKKRIPATVLRTLALRWQVFMAYTSKDDTMYLCVNNIDKAFEYVKSMKDLKEVFNTIQISRADNIEFVSPIKGLFIKKHMNI